MSDLYFTKAAFEHYTHYLALKRHFTSDYDFFKYNGKISAKPESFKKRKDKYIFYKLSKLKYGKDYILANIINNPDIWSGDLLTDQAIQSYKSWKNTQESLTYKIQQDLSKLDINFNSNFIIHDGQYPKLLTLYNHGDILLETITVLVTLTGCDNYWDKKINDTIFYPDVMTKIKKYSPFLSYDQNKLKKIIANKFTD